MQSDNRYKVKQSHFPIAMAGITLAVLLLMAGIQFGLILLVNLLELNAVLSVSIIIGYWAGVALLITFITGWQMKNAYELPMKQMAEAADKVAGGDFSVYLSPIHTMKKIDYLDVMIMDFNKMVEELGSMEILKTEFFSNVSHEIKTPISVIYSAAQLLSDDTLLEAEKHEYINQIMISSRKLTNLITNMLKLNKLEKQNIQPVSESYDICEQLCGCIIQFDGAMEEKDIEFDAKMEDKAWICGDESLLELVWTNLLSNAVKFTPNGGKIVLRQTSNDRMVKVEIQDFGCGMSEETIRHIFDKFYQGDTSHSTEGNGLGLALTLRILQLLDGNIDVESEEGKGTIFKVTLPIGEQPSNMDNRGERNE